jgi:hypothetical protein
MKRALISLLLASLPGVVLADAQGDEIARLKAQLNALQSRMDAMQKAGGIKSVKSKSAAAATTAPAASAQAVASDDPAPAVISADDIAEMKQQLASMQLKVDSLQTASTEGPLAGLSVTGYLDPTYIYNRNANSSSFQFVNHNSAYNYDTSTIGDVYLDIKKTFGVGPTAPSVEFSIMPNRGNGNTLLANDKGAIGNNIINTAQITYPLSDTTQVVAGLISSYGGYEVQQSNQTLAITHNLLYDFSDPGSYVGAGVYWSHGQWAVKSFIGNEQYRTRGSSVQTGSDPNNNNPLFKSNNSPTVTARVDYTWSSALDIGGSFNVGRQTLVTGSAAANANGVVSNGCQSGNTGFGYQCSSKDPFSRYYFTEVDFAYQLPDAQLNAEVDYGNQKNAAWNGGDAVWYGVSLQAHQKWTTELLGRMGVTFRYDYLDDSKNGGGGGGIVLGSQGYDGSNGFGIDFACLANSSSNGSECKGANRQALAAALLFYPIDQLIVKMEYRHDWANHDVFVKHNGSFTKTNDVVGASMVYTF